MNLTILLSSWGARSWVGVPVLVFLGGCPCAGVPVLVFLKGMYVSLCRCQPGERQTFSFPLQGQSRHLRERGWAGVGCALFCPPWDLALQSCLPLVLCLLELLHSTPLSPTSFSPPEKLATFRDIIMSFVYVSICMGVCPCA